MPLYNIPYKVLVGINPEEQSNGFTKLSNLFLNTVCHSLNILCFKAKERKKKLNSFFFLRKLQISLHVDSFILKIRAVNR